MALEIKERAFPQPEELSPPPATFAAPENTPLLDLCIVLAKRKVLILGLTVAAAALSAVIALLLPNVYTARVRMLPPQQNQSMAIGMLGQMAPLLGAAVGKDLGLRDQSEIYVAMLHSRTVEDALIDRFSLISVYHARLREDARNRLEEMTQIESAKSGVISVSVDDRDPRQAAEIANAYVDQLEKLTRTLAVTDASRRRLFFEREVKTAGDELAAAEDALRQTQESSGVIQLDSQSRVMLASLAGLRAQVAAKEVQVQSMSSYATQENPDLVRSERELSALRDQVARFEQGGSGRSPADVAMAKVPTAGLEYVRRLRDVKYRETLLELLTRQYEAARIDEGKGATIVQVLDPAIPPERRSRPLRWAIVALSTLLAFLVFAVWVLIAEGWRIATHHPQFAARVQLLRAYSLRGFVRTSD